MSEVARTLAEPTTKVEAFRKALAEQISTAFERDYLSFEKASPTPGGSSTIYRLICPSTSIAVIDGRGQEQQVIEVVQGRGWQVLVGMTCNFMPAGQSKLRFTDCQIITFLRSPPGRGTPAGDAMQIMRLEWEALDQNSNYDGEIAHPHWQLDVARFAEAKPATIFENPVLDRIPGPPAATDLTWISDMHLAASAAWAIKDWADERPVPHVSGPQDLDELRRWIVSACRYLRYQLSNALSD